MITCSAWLLSFVMISTAPVASSDDEPWRGFLPETPPGLETIQEGWIEGYRSQLEQQLFAFVTAYQLDATDEQRCRDKIYSLWLDEARHYHDTFDALAQLRQRLDEDGDGQVDEQHQETYKAAFFKLRDNAPLRIDRLVAALEAMLPPADYSAPRKDFYELIFRFGQLRNVRLDDRVRESGAGRTMKQARMARTAKLTDAGHPMPHLVALMSDYEQQAEAAAAEQTEDTRQEAAKVQATRQPGVPALKRGGLPHAGRETGPSQIEGFVATEPALATWVSLVSGATRGAGVDPVIKDRAMGLLQQFRERLTTYVASHVEAYAFADAQTSWAEYRRLHEPLNEPLEAMTAELKLRLEQLVR